MSSRGWSSCWGVAASFVFAAFAVAQGPGGPGGPGFFGGGDNTLFLLRDERVRKELELVESQEQKLAALGDKMREEMRMMFSGVREMSEEDRRKFFEGAQEKMRARADEMRKELDEILLPQQRDRLKQIALQARMRFQSTSQAVTSGEVAEALKLTDEQKEKLASRQKEIDEEYRQESEKLRAKYRDKLLEVLTPEQQAKWKELMGAPIELSPPQFGGRGRGGDRGGSNPQ